MCVGSREHQVAARTVNSKDDQAIPKCTGTRAFNPSDLLFVNEALKVAQPQVVAKGCWNDVQCMQARHAVAANGKLAL